MKAYLGGAALAAIALLSGCGEEGGNVAAPAVVNDAAPLEQVAAPNGDWTEVVSETEDGGFLMGNPNAPVKLVEYASMTCHVCAEFSEAATAPLENTYIKSGQVSWEVRPFLLFPTDPGITMLLRCQGAAPFFRLTEQLYATQDEWSGRLQQLPPAQLQQLQSLPPQQQIGALLEATGLDQFFRQRGMPDARIKSCLADQQGLDRLVRFNQIGAERDGVSGTPTFFINGERVENVVNWAQLEPVLREAIG